jgi:recombination protein RecT
MTNLNATLQVRSERTNEPGLTLSDMLEAQGPAIAKALPSNMSPERFTRNVLTVIKANPKLLECTPYSILASMMLCAQLNLEPGPLGHAYFVPYRNNNQQEAQFQIGYKGMLELARRSGEILSIEARIVNTNDEFEFEYGLVDVLKHKPNRADPGAMVDVYALAKFTNGGHQFTVMSKAEVDKIRAVSKSKGSPAWSQHYNAMAKKTVLRQQFTYLPSSVETQKALLADGTTPLEISPRMVDVQAAQPYVEERDTPPDSALLADPPTAKWSIDRTVQWVIDLAHYAGGATLWLEAFGVDELVDLVQRSDKPNGLPGLLMFVEHATNEYMDEPCGCGVCV